MFPITGNSPSALILFIRYTVKPVLRGHIWDKEKMAL